MRRNSGRLSRGDPAISETRRSGGELSNGSLRLRIRAQMIAPPQYWGQSYLEGSGTIPLQKKRIPAKQLNHRLNETTLSARRLLLPLPRPMIQAVFLRRPQRFLAEVMLGPRRVLAYCPNPGSFSGCLEPGSKALLWKSTDARRKRTLTLRAVRHAGVWIGTDTHLANRIAEAAIRAGVIQSLAKSVICQREPRGDAGCRLDLSLLNGHQEVLVEVKSAMVAHSGIAQFPDSPSLRAVAHLKELTRRARLGQHAVLLFVVQRGDVSSLQINGSCYLPFTIAYREAVEAGVDVHAIRLTVSARGFVDPCEISVTRP